MEMTWLIWAVYKAPLLSNLSMSITVYGKYALDQVSSNLSLEVQSAAEFSTNPDQTHLPVIV